MLEHNMEGMHARLFFVLFCSAFTYQLKNEVGHALIVQDPESEWERMEQVIGEDLTQEHSPETQLWKSTSDSEFAKIEAKKPPEFQIVSTSKDQKELFKPEKGSRPLPDSVKAKLLAATVVPTTKSPTSRKKMIEILCHTDRMYVRIVREIFKTPEAYKYLKLGTCVVSAGTKEHYYLLYLLTANCGFKKESTTDERVVRINLSYKPTGPVMREMPFDIPLQCKYPRFFNSFKVGFYPKLKGGTVFKALQPKSSFSLTPQDASGNVMTGSSTYTLGQPMYFEAKQPEKKSKSGDQRLYINKCFTTASQDSSSTPKYTVIDNQGCMVDSKVAYQSKFLTGSSKMSQKFAVASMVFKDQPMSSSKTQQLYMHCEISMGKLDPSPSAKACNYDRTTKKWKALYGDDSVCTCCESTCSSAQPKASRNMVSSHSWKISFGHTDEYAAIDNLQSLDADDLTLPSLDMSEHGDYMKYWDRDP